MKKTKKKIFPGTLFLIVGNSGAGKDLIISGAINELPPNFKQVHLVKRFITRPPSETEDNYSVSIEEFNEMENQGKFALKWHIYGLDYGVPIEIDDWLNNGHSVIVNVSRTIIYEAREIYEKIKVVFIEVPFKITLKRIKERGREKGELLKKRIERARNHQRLPNADFTVDNSGDLDDSINQFLNFLIMIIKENYKLEK